jgi:hypothetical protein
MLVVKKARTTGTLAGFTKGAFPQKSQHSNSNNSNNNSASTIFKSLHSHEHRGDAIPDQLFAGDILASKTRSVRERAARSAAELTLSVVDCCCWVVVVAA